MSAHYNSLVEHKRSLMTRARSVGNTTAAANLNKQGMAVEEHATRLRYFFIHVVSLLRGVCIPSQA